MAFITCTALISPEFSIWTEDSFQFLFGMFDGHVVDLQDLLGLFTTLVVECSGFHVSPLILRDHELGLFLCLRLSVLVGLDGRLCLRNCCWAAMSTGSAGLASIRAAKTSHGTSTDASTCIGAQSNGLHAFWLRCVGQLRRHFRTPVDVIKMRVTQQLFHNNFETGLSQTTNICFSSLALARLDGAVSKAPRRPEPNQLPFWTEHCPSSGAKSQYHGVQHKGCVPCVI